MALPPPAANSTCLVTGASSGIGVELARALARRGHGVTLIARRKERLEELARELAEAHGVRVEALTCDLQDPTARDRLEADIASLGLTVEVLCNNAGFGTTGRFIRLDRERELGMVRLNCEAVVDLCGRYAPTMAERGRGAILNVVSTAAFQPIPHQATYAASKAFALSFTEALQQELRGHGVTVTALCPGPVRTEFLQVADAQEFENAPSFLFESAKNVAETGVRGLERNRRVVIPGALNKATSITGQHVPRWFFLRFAERFHPLGGEE
jgi:uncharacterized protein